MPERHWGYRLESETLAFTNQYTIHVSILGFNAKAQDREEVQGDHFFVILCELCVSAALR
jgi:hypothetical protein